MSKVGLWLIAILAALCLMRPQGAPPSENLSAQYAQSLSADSEGDEETNDMVALIIAIVVVVIIICAASEASETEVQNT